MIEALARVLGRLPVGWLQLRHNPGRLAAAIAGVAFGNILVLMQLGFLGALVGSIRLPYDMMDAEILVSASDANTLSDGSPLPRQRMYEALAVPGVRSAVPLHLGKLDWRQPDGTIRTLTVLGIDPAAHTLRSPEVDAALDRLTLADTAVIDRRTRNVPAVMLAAIDRGQPLVFEAKGRTLTVVATFTIGGGFSDDGFLVVSDQTFLKLFPQRAAGAPNHILVVLEPGADRRATLARLRAALPAYDTNARSKEEAIAKDQAFQTTQRPVGLVFGFGIVIGVLVGLVIVYQVLSSDVADHLREYATFKAMGFPQRFFLSVVFEEALILAVLGFLPGLLIALGLYALVAAMTGLPLAMTGARAVAVLLGTIVTCTLSGAIATRRLARANPADLF
ncbi:MAG: FtsX-like permease family protein [Alphaproteobacteria bacterium]|nr:FtsX-like permease family protein [Alphaproteobacteria bacterium]